MNEEEAFACWAPEGSPWSPWVKPVLFTQLDGLPPAADPTPTLPAVPWAPPAEAVEHVDADGAGYRDAARVAVGVARTALVIDLPGLDAVAAGLGLGKVGYRPVPLFNACMGYPAVLDLEPLARMLRAAAPIVRDLGLPAGAPPAFLLDARRLTGKPDKGMFDNRWMVFPQDFPSGRLLRDRGIARAVVARPDGSRWGEDLAHVLLGWHKAGVDVEVLDVTSTAPPRKAEVERPRRFGWLAYRVLAALGLRRSSAGGFGSHVPGGASGVGAFG